jgi:UDP-N-acetylglucosamine 2-epimerase (non-hydrolysing)
MKIAIVLGTRPEIIKFSPIIKECERKGIDYFVLHTGQHYDFNMDRIFFKELGLEPKSMVNLDVGSGTHGETTAKIITGAEKIFLNNRPDIVLVQGDTNTVLAASLVSKKMHIKLGHVEAGLRSYDRRMPEEYNRILCDHMSDYLYAPTELAEKTLHGEGLAKRDILYYDGFRRQEIMLTGNTIVDAVQQNIERANTSDVFSRFGIRKGEYFLATAHREENVDHRERLLGILTGLRNIATHYRMPVVYPMHPRTKKKLEEFGLTPSGLIITEPLGFFDLLALESNARLILTDSGGIQEEACSLRVPCVVVRDSSDRQESIEAGASMLAGTDPDRILRCAEIMLEKERNWTNPFGDGHAAERILRHAEKNLT